MPPDAIVLGDGLNKDPKIDVQTMTIFKRGLDDEDKKKASCRGRLLI